MKGMEKKKGLQYGDVLLNIDENGDKIVIFVTMTNKLKDECSGKAYVVGYDRIEYIQNYEVSSKDLPNYVVISPKVMREAVWEIKRAIKYADSIIKPGRESKKEKKKYFKAYITATGDTFIVSGSVSDDESIYEDKAMKIGNDFFGTHPILFESEIQGSESFYISGKTYDDILDLYKSTNSKLDEILVKAFWIQVRRFVYNWKELYRELPEEL